VKRWPLVRHLRFWWLRWRFQAWWWQCRSLWWLAPHGTAEAYLGAVWRGEV